MTVRQEPNADSKAIGRMFKGDGGMIIEQTEDGWTKVKSGNVEGYVSNEYLHFGQDAYEASQEAATLTATSLTGGLRIRSEASTEAKNSEKRGRGREAYGYRAAGRMGTGAVRGG